MTTPGEEGGGTGWWGKIRAVAPAVPDNIPLLRTEVQALEELSRFLFLEAHELQNALERMEWSTTCQGKYFNVLGYFFSIYCTWKIFISTVNIVFDRVGKVRAQPALVNTSKTVI